MAVYGPSGKAGKGETKKDAQTTKQGRKDQPFLLSLMYITLLLLRIST